MPEKVITIAVSSAETDNVNQIIMECAPSGRIFAAAAKLKAAEEMYAEAIAELKDVLLEMEEVTIG